MSNLSVTIIQDVLHWHNPAGNRAMYDAHFENIDETDLIVLPEMFSTGFSMHPKDSYETMDGETVAWMLEMAEHKDAVITGSLIMKLDEKTFVNRMLWVKPDGTFEYYDKRHLFRYGKEHINFTAGDERVIVELNSWRFALFVCYDLRFPVWSRNRDDYDVAIYVANWPSPRQFAWDSLLVARAIENQSYVVGVNRIGEDDIGNAFSGGTALLDFMGKAMVDCKGEQMVATQTLDMQALKDFHGRFPAKLDADDFEIKK